jgi:catechol 2,3-dioxygenase-like lactoylglutathione lyase family enzyme
MKSTLEVPRADWLAARADAAELDLDKGGYCDFRRPNAIHFWAGPDNQPAGFDHPFLTGVFSAPRAYLGVATAELLHFELVRVTLEVRNEAAREAAVAAAEAAGLSPREVGTIEQRALEGSAADLEWLEGQFHRLCRYASGRLLG